MPLPGIKARAGTVCVYLQQLEWERMTSGLLLPSWLSVPEKTRQQIVSPQQIPASQISPLPAQSV